jgi:hypothetical protein
LKRNLTARLSPSSNAGVQSAPSRTSENSDNFESSATLPVISITPLYLAPSAGTSRVTRGAVSSLLKMPPQAASPKKTAAAAARTTTTITASRPPKRRRGITISSRGVGMGALVAVIFDLQIKPVLESKSPLLPGALA